MSTGTYAASRVVWDNFILAILDTSRKCFFSHIDSVNLSMDPLKMNLGILIGVLFLNCSIY